MMEEVKVKRQPMSDLSSHQMSRHDFELAAANRRLTTAILGMTLLTGLVACLSYLAGRTVTHIKTESATVVRTEIPPPPLVIQPTPVAAPPPAPRPAPAAAPVVAAAPSPPPAGALYLQVGLMNPALDRSMQDRLIRLGFDVKLVPMDGSPTARVLVGPVQSAEQQRAFESKLSAAGFQFFRRYN